MFVEMIKYHLRPGLTRHKKLEKCQISDSLFLS